MAISFPSTEYFEALKAQMAANEEKFRRLGFIDTTFGVTVGVNGKARNFVLEFEVFDLKNVSEVPAIDLKKVDFQIEGDSRVWREMIENIRRNGEADSSHDINTLAHFGERLKIVYDDPDGHDKLYRFMESIQEFFDLSSKLEVSFNLSRRGGAGDDGIPFDYELYPGQGLHRQVAIHDKDRRDGPVVDEVGD